MKLQTVYTDTSVFGGVFDDEFTMPSREFFDLIQQGRFELIVSDIAIREIACAPSKVQSFYKEMSRYVRIVPIDDEILHLRDAFVSAGIVGEKWADDAGHVASAVVGRADLIVSWNFKHIVHFDKIPLYNAVSILNGYHAIDIRSPAEVIDYEE